VSSGLTLVRAGSDLVVGVNFGDATASGRMARPPRLEEPGAIHHVFARGVAKLPVYLDAEDRVTYLEILEDVVVAFEWRLLSYCLMENHLHLLVETVHPNLGSGMQRLHGRYGRGFNRRHGFSGHVFESRYGSVRIKDDAHLWTAAAYVVRNPVEAQLVSQAADWPWSSYRAAADSEGPTWLALERLYEHFSVFGGDPATRYREFIAQLD
jgi:putative transposase